MLHNKYMLYIISMLHISYKISYIYYMFYVLGMYADYSI